MTTSKSKIISVDLNKKVSVHPRIQELRAKVAENFKLYPKGIDMKNCFNININAHTYNMTKLFDRWAFMAMAAVNEGINAGAGASAAKVTLTAVDAHNEQARCFSHAQAQLAMTIQNLCNGLAEDGYARFLEESQPVLASGTEIIQNFSSDWNSWDLFQEDETILAQNFAISAQLCYAVLSQRFSLVQEGFNRNLYDARFLFPFVYVNLCTHMQMNMEELIL